MTTLIESIKVTLERAANIPREVGAAHKVSEPPDSSLGDLSSNLALVAAKALGKPPLELANTLAEQLKKEAAFSEVSVAGPGFINLRFADRTVANTLSGALSDRYGSSDRHTGKKARVEFISANPTGPLHIGNARGAPLGDTIANVLQANGFTVLREYLHNDVGGQVKKFGEALTGASHEYTGEYVKELAKKIGPVTDPDEAGRKAVGLMLKEILDDAKTMGVTFDKVYHESEFVSSGKTKAALEKIKASLKQKDSAKWFAPSDEFLKDRETVVIRSDGSYTYFANDIAYHDLKFSEGYDLVIDELGAGHHGHVPRLKAVVKSLGHDVGKLKFVLHQNVRVKRGNEVVKMSKRAGTFVTASEVLDEVGKDAFRFFMLMSEPNTHMDFDLELAKKQSRENPVYYVQYAIARIYSILAKLKTENLKFKTEGLELDNPKIRQLALQLVRYPDLVVEIGETLEVHRLSHYAIKTASQFHDFYESVRVLGGEHESSRLTLAKATLNVLEQCLKLMGISAPKKM